MINPVKALAAVALLLVVVGCGAQGGGKRDSATTDRSEGRANELVSYIQDHAEILAQYPAHVASEAVLQQVLVLTGKADLREGARTLMRAYPEHDVALASCAYLLDHAEGDGVRTALCKSLRDEFPNSPFALMAFDAELQDRAARDDDFATSSAELLTSGLGDDEAFIVHYRRGEYFARHYQYGKAAVAYLRATALDQEKGKKLGVPLRLAAALKSGGWLLEARSIPSGADQSVFAAALAEEMGPWVESAGNGDSFPSAYFNPEIRPKPGALARDLTEAEATTDPVQIARMACYYGWHADYDTAAQYAQRFARDLAAGIETGRYGPDQTRRLQWAVDGMMAEHVFFSDSTREVGERRPGEIRLGQMPAPSRDALAILIRLGVELAIEGMSSGEVRAEVIEAMVQKRADLLISMADHKGVVSLWEYCVAEATEANEAARYLGSLATYYREHAEDSGKAIETYERLIALEPDKQFVEEARIRIMLAYSDLEKHGEVFESAERFLSENPSEALRTTALYLRAIALVNMDGGNGSKETLFALTSDHPDHSLAPKALLWLVHVEMTGEHYGEALNRTRDLLARFPDSREAARASELTAQLEALAS